MPFSKELFQLSKVTQDRIGSFARRHGFQLGAKIARCVHIKNEDDIDGTTGNRTKGYIMLLCAACFDEYVGKKDMPSDLLIEFADLE